MLTQRMVISEEVRELAANLRQRGDLLVEVSDKADEASAPGAAQAQVAMKPLHQLDTLTIAQV